MQREKIIIKLIWIAAAAEKTGRGWGKSGGGVGEEGETVLSLHPKTEVCLREQEPKHFPPLPVLLVNV